MKVTIALIMYLSFGLSAAGQQWIQFSQQANYKISNNPSLSGTESQLYTTLAHRSQYTFHNNTPLATQFFEFSMPIGKRNYGIGIRLINDFIGYQRFTQAELTGAYHLYTRSGVFSFGLGIGATNLNINGEKLRASGGNYENELVIHNDELIPNENIGGLSPNFSLGFSYQLENWKIGVSMLNINSPEIILSNNSSSTNIFIDRTINAQSSFVIETKKINITPSILYKTDLVKHQLQFGALAELGNFSFGLSFRGYSGYNNDAIIGELGLKIIDKIRIHYSYDYNVSGLNKASLGSHEISIRYMMNQKFSTKKKGNSLFNPRFL